jgi:CRP/FNR family nitrogen fixation transcriptional regulator
MFLQEGLPAIAGYTPDHQSGRLDVPGVRLSAVRRYGSGDAIFAQGDHSGPLFAVAFGCIRICRLTSEGRRQVSAFHFEGDLFGFEGAPERRFYAEAIENSGVCLVSSDKDNHDAKTILGLMMNHLCHVQDHLLVLGTQNATERVAAFLADIAERRASNGIVRLPMSRDDIAAYLGLTLETVSRALHRLQESGLIELVGVRQIRLIDMGALKALGD